MLSIRTKREAQDIPSTSRLDGCSVVLRIPDGKHKDCWVAQGIMETTERDLTVARRTREEDPNSSTAAESHLEKSCRGETTEVRGLICRVCTCFSKPCGLSYPCAVPCSRALGLARGDKTLQLRKNVDDDMYQARKLPSGIGGSLSCERLESRFPRGF